MSNIAKTLPKIIINSVFVGLFIQSPALSAKTHISTETEISLSIDKESAENVINFFDLEHNIRHDYYLSLFLRNKFILENLSFRMKVYPGKSRPIIQIAEKSDSRFQCGRYLLKSSSKTKFDYEIGRKHFEKIAESYAKVEKKIRNSSVERKDFSSLEEKLVSTKHPEIFKILNQKSEDAVITPIKKSLHKKFHRHFKIEEMIVKISVGVTSDYIESEKIAERYDLELSTEDNVSLRHFKFIACNLLRKEDMPKVNQVPSNRNAELITRSRLTKIFN